MKLFRLWIIEFTVLGLAVLAELLIGGIFAVYCPLAVLAVVYYSEVDSLPTALLDAVVAGTVIDMVVGRGELFSPFLLLASLCAARIVLRHEPDSLWLCALAGGAAALGAVVAESVLAGFSGVLHFISIAVFSVAVGALAMPAAVVILDGVGRLFGAPLFLPERQMSPDARRAARNRRVRLTSGQRSRP